MRHSISDEQKKYAWNLVQSVNYGRRGEADGNQEMQYTGILGEVCFADLMELPRPVAKDGWDNGIDFVISGKNVDLKTMARTIDSSPNFVNNLIVSQVERGQTDIYIFSTINKNTSTIEFVGWIPKRNLRREWIIRRGTERTRRDGTSFAARADMYEIPNKILFPFLPASFSNTLSIQ